MKDSILMPNNWDNHDEWENYYKALPEDKYLFETETKCPGSFSFDRIEGLISELYERDWNSIWFPGCGFSPLPRAFSLFGFNVHATDIAPSAIKFQNNNETIVQPLISSIKLKKKSNNLGCLNASIHDFRTHFMKHKVDVIFNIKAIQGLPLQSMQSAIQSHYEAIRPGGIAFFDTMNVQGEKRDQLEEILVNTGFHVPLYELNKWFRKSLADTNIPYAFILGAPMIPQNDEYPHKHGSPEYERDRGILRDIFSEYRSRTEAEYTKEAELVNEQTKHAQIIYSTG